MTQVSGISRWVRERRLVHGYYMRPEEIELYQLDGEGRDPTNYVGYRFFDLIIRPVLNESLAAAAVRPSTFLDTLANEPSREGRPQPNTSSCLPFALSHLSAKENREARWLRVRPGRIVSTNLSIPYQEGVFAHPTPSTAPQPHERSGLATGIT